MSSKTAVVVVAYHSEHILSRCVASIRRFEPDCRIFVVDNGRTLRPEYFAGFASMVEAGDSPDWSLSVDQSTVVVIDPGANIGYGAACNLGAQVALSVDSSYIAFWFLNPDVELVGPVIDALEASLSAGASAVVPVVSTRNGSKRPSAWGRPGFLRSFKYASELQTPAINRKWAGVVLSRLLPSLSVSIPGSVSEGDVDGHLLGGVLLVSSDRFLAIAGFDERYFLFWEDADLCERLRALGDTLAVVQSVHVTHDEGTSVQSSDESSIAWSGAIRRELYFQGLRLYGSQHMSNVRLWSCLGGWCLGRSVAALLHSIDRLRKDGVRPSRSAALKLVRSSTKSDSFGSEGSKLTAGVTYESPRFWIGDITVDCADRSSTIERIRNSLTGEARPLVVASVNLDHVGKFRYHGPPNQNAGANWLFLVDGWPVQSAVRARFGVTLPLLTGADLLPDVLTLADKEGATVGFVGGYEAHQAQLAGVLTQYLPSLKVVFIETPTLDQIDESDAVRCLIERIKRLSPDLLVVGLGKPKQEILIDRLVANRVARVYCAFGASAEFISGAQTRAPRAIRSLRMEWAYRLLLDPRRLARRYVLESPTSLWYLRRAPVVRQGGLPEGRTG